MGSLLRKSLTGEPLSEIEWRVLKATVERSPKSRLKRERELKKLDRLWKERRLVRPPDETPKEKHGLCEGRFLFGDYTDWTGWEFRHPFPWGLVGSGVSWTGGPGKLHVVGEQGVGDEIFFSRWLPAGCVFQCYGKMASIFRRSRPDIEIVGGRTETVDLTVPSDCIISEGDLPRVLKTRPAAPWLLPLEGFAEYQGRVGISWRGAQGEYDWREFLALYPDAVSLQYDQRDDELVERPPFDLKDDMEALLSLIGQLRLVVSVSTTVAHLAGAAGAPMMIILADPRTGRNKEVVPWRWLNQSRPTPQRSYWYPSATVYRNLNERKALKKGEQRVQK